MGLGLLCLVAHHQAEEWAVPGPPRLSVVHPLLGLLRARKSRVGYDFPGLHGGHHDEAEV